MAGQVGIADKPQMRLEASLGKGFTQPSNAAGNTTGPGIQVRAFKAEDGKLQNGVPPTLQYHWGLHKPPDRSAQGSSLVRSSCCLRDRGAQPLHGGGHPFALIKNRRSGDQHGGSGGHDQWRCCRINAPVYLQVASELALRNHLADSPDLWQGSVDERLMSEARVDGHNQYLVYVWQDFLQHYRRGCRVNGYPDAFAQCLDAVHGAVQMVVAFPVDKKGIGAGLGKLLEE